MEENLKNFSLAVLLWVALLLSSSVWSQTAFNSDVKMSATPKIGYWFKDKTSNAEMLIYDQNSVGYMKTYRKVLEILNFHNIDFNDTQKDETFISSIAKIEDFEMMSLTLRTEGSYVMKIWVGSGVAVIWLSDNETNGVSIKNIE